METKMVNKYKRKTEQATWDDATMQIAMEESKRSLVSAAAKKYGITLSTLQRHLKKEHSEKSLRRYRRVFDDDQEVELMTLYSFHVNDIFYGLTKSEFLKLVYAYAEINNISHPFKEGRAGNDWYVGFKKRHPDISFKQSEQTTNNKQQMQKGQKKLSSNKAVVIESLEISSEEEIYEIKD